MDPIGSRAALYPMPESGEAPLLTELRRARTSIDVSCYVVQDRAVIGALKAAARRGVQVRVMMEPRPVEGGHYGKVARELGRAGVSVRPTPPVFDQSGKVDHAKFICIDRRELLIGSGNLVRSGLGGTPGATDRDFWLSDSRSESATEAEGLFQADWTRQPAQAISFQNLVVTPDNARRRLGQLVDAAKKRVWVYNQELLDPGMIDRLVAAKKRGVDVQVLTAAPDEQGRGDPNGSALQRLRGAGIAAREVSGLHLHAKAILSDGVAFVGSQNFSYSGLSRNRELGDIVEDPGVVQGLARVFQEDQASG